LGKDSSDWFQVQWLVFSLVWVSGAGTSKRTTQREPIRNRIIHGSLLALAFLLLFESWRLGRLDPRFVPATEGISFCGLVLTGLGFAIWARLTIGRDWSGFVTIKEDHQLIRQGPYRLARHPIYFRILLAMLGTAIGYGRTVCLIAVPIAFLAFWKKSRTEEQFMLAQFGAQYSQYQRKVKGFLPGLL
jgi:protein-S-isoprenylcysteine O-methyltransferase Ste14